MATACIEIGTRSSEPPSEAPDVHSSTDDYAGRFAGPVGEFLLQMQTQTVLELTARRRGCRILDVGGGHAQLAGPLISSGFDVTILGSDTSCRYRLDRLLEPGSFHFIEGNMLELPLETNSFDVVLAFRMLPHMRRWQDFLGELCRVSRADVLVDFPSKWSLNMFSHLLFGVKRNIEGNTRPYRCFWQSDVTREFHKHGFSALALRKQFFLPMALHRGLGRSGLSQKLESASSVLGLTRRWGSPIILRSTTAAGEK